MMNAYILEQLNFKLLTEPVDLNTAAVVGGRVRVEGERLALLILLGASTAATVAFSLKQHNAVSSGTTKALSIANPYFHKVAGQTKFTKVEPTSATDSYDLSALFGDAAGIVAFEVLPEDLDVNNNFDHVSVDIADSAAAKLATVVAVVGGMRNLPAYAQVI